MSLIRDQSDKHLILQEAIHRSRLSGGLDKLAWFDGKD